MREVFYRGADSGRSIDLFARGFHMVRQGSAERRFTPDAEKGDGWYLLRRGVVFHGQRYGAGSVVERLSGCWYVDGAENGEKRSLPLEPSMVCDVSYEGISLFVVECKERKLLYARPVLSSVPLERIDPMLVTTTLQPGESRVCARFGKCFLPLEFFGW